MTQEDKEIYEKMLTDYYVGYCRGSIVYGTFNPGVSDEDYLYVVPDAYHEFLSQFPRGIGQYTKIKDNLYYSYKDLDGDWRIGGQMPDIECDFEFVSETTFLNMIDNNDIVALEAIFLSDGHGYWYGLDCKHNEYRDRFVLDKWKLRTSISSICSNSWVKCKKKLTVEKDYNLRIAQKSLWHSLRLYMFGIQIATDGKITDWGCANHLWNEIENAEDKTWDYYKAKYQPLFNSLRSEMVKLCDRPKD